MSIAPRRQGDIDLFSQSRHCPNADFSSKQFTIFDCVPKLLFFGRKN
jgi:hypothetical protein